VCTAFALAVQQQIFIYVICTLRMQTILICMCVYIDAYLYIYICNIGVHSVCAGGTAGDERHVAHLKIQ